MTAGEVSTDPMVFTPLRSNFRQNWSQGGGVGAHMLRNGKRLLIIKRIQLTAFWPLFGNHLRQLGEKSITSIN